MEFRTNINFQTPYHINYHDKIGFIGSCFAEESSKYIENLGFHVFTNPFGILFNPASIYLAIDRIIEKKHFHLNEIIHNGIYFHTWQHHSIYHSFHASSLLEKINSSLDYYYKKLTEVDYFFITYGTAHCFKRGNTIVSNCHKYPQQDFNKILLSPDEVFKAGEQTLLKLIKINPKIKVIFTISPVKYLKDGHIENNRSKSILNVALHELISAFDVATYYPSYEIMQDDLRDYRFYKSDLIHPSQEAISYILSHFATAYFNSDTIEIVKEVEKYNHFKNHKIMFQSPDILLEHKKKLETLRQQLIVRYPFLKI